MPGFLGRGETILQGPVASRDHRTRDGGRVAPCKPPPMSGEEGRVPGHISLSSCEGSVPGGSHTLGPRVALRGGTTRAAPAENLLRRSCYVVRHEDRYRRRVSTHQEWVGWALEGGDAAEGWVDGGALVDPSLALGFILARIFGAHRIASEAAERTRPPDVSMAKDCSIDARRDTRLTYLRQTPCG